MSFFKKFLAREDLTPEQKEKMEKEKAEKKAQKEKQAKELRERYEREKEAKQAEKERRKQMELEQVVRFFGPNPGFTAKTNYSIYKKTLMYMDQHVFNQEEKILGTIPAEYDKTKNREIKGVLVATSDRLIFATSSFGHGEFVEIFEYHKMNGIALAPDGFAQKELLIDYGRSRKVFDDIANDDNFKRFLNTVRDKIHESKRTGGKTTRTTKKTDTPKDDKYDKLSKLGALLEQGILTQEEFEIEKQKLLKS